MSSETTSSEQSENRNDNVLSLRDGIYRLKVRLTSIDAPHEILLHGVSRLADALRIARFFEENPLADALG